MNAAPLEKHTVSFALSLAITSLLSALLVVIKETNKDSVFAWMAAATGHHWVSHGVLVVFLFLALGWFLGRIGLGAQLSGNALSAIITASVALSSLIIAGFFI